MQEETNQPSLEERFSHLDQILERMESGEISLEESFALYRDGMNEVKACTETIGAVEAAVLALDEDGTLVPFAPEDEEA